MIAVIKIDVCNVDLHVHERMITEKMLQICEHVVHKVFTNIARALAVEPEVLLMDEPASALDPISTAKIEELIYNLKQNYTIVVVTHNMQQAARISDETGFFLNGKLVEFNETKKIFTAPGMRETEDYITGRFG